MVRTHIAQTACYRWSQPRVLYHRGFTPIQSSNDLNYPSVKWWTPRESNPHFLRAKQADSRYQ